MGYKRAFVHRMAEELERLASSGEQDEIADEDVQGIILSLFEMHRPLDDELADLAVSLYECRIGGMYEAFEELPDVLDSLEEAIASHRGYDTLDAYLAGRAGLERIKSKSGVTIYIED